MPENTTTLIQAYISKMNGGDESARAELLRHAGTRLERLAHRMLQEFPRVRRWEETGDVLNNGLVRLLKSLEVVKFNSAKEFFRLAALQIRRELLDLARHYYGPQGMGRRHDSGEEPAPADDPAEVTFNPERLAAWTEFHEQVEALPEEEKAVFDLLWYQELTQAEASAILDVPVITVRRRWLAARLRLQAFLKNGSAVGG